MKPTGVLTERWIKASILGTVWASSEIVFGSFLHNLRVPLSGDILTAVGLVIMISIGHTWRERGLFWRAGLITALMKTMSPSAVIFGPMVAIFAESILLEISTSLLGRSTIGFISGAILAMSWNMFQMIANFIIYYGFDIIGIYAGLLRMAKKEFGISMDLTWFPIILLLLAHVAFGAAAGAAGVITGRKLAKKTLSANAGKLSVGDGVHLRTGKKVETAFDYSMAWLVMDFLLVIVVLALINFAQWTVWIPVVTAVISLWSVRYRRTLRRLARPGFWFYFILITMITTLVINRTGSVWDGFVIGLRMNFRAALLITGFSVLGTELYNPQIRGFFMETRFRQLPVALELSFDTLPTVIESIPDLKTFIRNPVAVLSGIIAGLEKLPGNLEKHDEPVAE